MGDEGDSTVNIERESDGDASLGRKSDVIAMDTPERMQINTPASKFEDSPVFNYLNSLSPIYSVNSLHVTRTFNINSFASPPPVFTSPHVSAIKDSRFLRRHQVSIPSRPELSSDNLNEVHTREELIGIARDSSEQQNIGPRSAASKPPYDSNLHHELSRTLNYESLIPDSDRTACSVKEIKSIPELIVPSTALVQSIHTDSGSFGIRNEFSIGGVSHIDQNKEVSECDCENLLSDEADLAIIKTSNDSKSLKDIDQKSLKHRSSFCTSRSVGLQNSGITPAVGPCQQSETDNAAYQIKEIENMKDIAENQDLLVSLSDFEAGGTNEIVDDELASNMHRGLRRRCLLFEMAGRKSLHGFSNTGPSTLSHSYEDVSSTDQCPVSINPGHDIPTCVLPGTGLPLKVLPSTSLNHNSVEHETLDTEKQPTSVSPLAHGLNSSIGQGMPETSFVANLSDTHMLPAGDMSIAENADHASEIVVDESSTHSSLKKKRRTSESSGESEACKRCHCKKSKCLKLYCECFAAGIYCVEPCACQECSNKPIHGDIVLAARRHIESRNPLAFAPKVIRSSESSMETAVLEEFGKTPGSARHKRGCNCKKSGCTKKYCECYQAGVGCSINCRCDGCKNTFGRKDGSTSIGTKVELKKENEGETCRSVTNTNLMITTIPNDAQQNTNFAHPETPLQLDRQLIELLHSSKSERPPRSTSLAIGSSSQEFVKQNPPEVNFEGYTTVQEDERCEMIQSPVNGVKSVSPNSKRVSPNCSTGFTPGLSSSSRKLILQSIPSFPSLTPKN